MKNTKLYVRIFAGFTLLLFVCFVSSCAGTARASLAEDGVSNQAEHQAAHEAIGQGSVQATLTSIGTNLYSDLLADPHSDTLYLQTSTGDDTGRYRVRVSWGESLSGLWAAGLGNYSLVAGGGSISVSGDKIVFPLQVQLGDTLACRLRTVSQTPAIEDAVEVLLCKGSKYMSAEGEKKKDIVFPSSPFYGGKQ